MDTIRQFKKLFMYGLIGSLIASAVVAVIAVLVGTFDELTGKVFGTLLVVMVHSLVSLLFIMDDEKKLTFDHLPLFSNTFFIVIMLSFMTSLAAIWDFVAGDTTFKLYMSYATLTFAALHADVLLKMTRKHPTVDMIVQSNILCMVFVFFLLQIAIHVGGSHDELPEFFYRVLAAFGIIDGTLSLIAAIVFKLQVNAHPEWLQDPGVALIAGAAPATSTTTADANGQPVLVRRGPSFWVILLIGYMLLQIVSMLMSYNLR